MWGLVLFSPCGKVGKTWRPIPTSSDSTTTIRKSNCLKSSPRQGIYKEKWYITVNEEPLGMLSSRFTNDGKINADLCICKRTILMWSSLDNQHNGIQLHKIIMINKINVKWDFPRGCSPYKYSWPWQAQVPKIFIIGYCVHQSIVQ